MGRIVYKNQPCLDLTNCGSSDARQVYEDGGSKCFSCNKVFPKMNATTPSPPPPFKPHKNKVSLEEIQEFGSRGFSERGITKTVCEFFKVKVSYKDTGEIDAHYYPYGIKDVEGYKIRNLPKTFEAVGKINNGLFGQFSFNGGGKRLIITEGEIDALSYAQAMQDKYGMIYPVVSVASATILEPLLKNREWIRSFEEVVIAFDNDKAGEEATEKAIKIVGFDKARIAKLPEKDPNEVFIKHGGDILLKCAWNAVAWSPAGIINKEDLWKELQDYNSKEACPYPPCLEGLNSKLKGKRTGEIVLFISGTGSGKSTILREDMLHVLETTNDKIGIVSLEEAPAETARKLSGMTLNRNPTNEEIPLDELKVGFDKVFGTDRVVLLNHQGSISDGSIIGQLEYMALMGCKYIYVDHITILVSEGADGLTGNEAIDKVMNALLRLVKSYDIWIGLVSHLRKAPSGKKSFEEGLLATLDDIKGSGSIKQICFDVIAFARNLTAETERERNRIKMSVLKARYTGLTGPVAGAAYTHVTGRLSYDELSNDAEIGEVYEV